MARNKNDYFQLMEQQVEYCVEASDLLEKIMSDYEKSDILVMKEKMHEIENAGDMLYHDIHSKLAVEFITPIDQEDILHLVQIIDDITDAIDEVVLYFYMYETDELPRDAKKLANIVSRCVAALSNAVKELKNFKKPAELRKYLVTVNDIEGESDIEYANAIHNLFHNCDDIKKLIGTKEIYESLESCCDLCEHAADIIEQVIIKNT